MLMNYWTLVESNNIARERGITFHNFEKSDYANGSYFDKYVTGEFVPKSDRVKELFKDVFIPVLLTGLNFAKRFKQMVFITKTVLLLLQMVLSATSTMFLLLSTRLRNVSKNVKKKENR